jgi:hypothetical protein
MHQHFEHYISVYSKKGKLISITVYGLLFLLLALSKWFLEEADNVWVKWTAIALVALSFARDIWRMNKLSKVELLITEESMHYNNPARFESRDLQWKNIKWVKIEALAIHFFSQNSFRNTLPLKDFKPEDVEQIHQRITTMLMQHQVQLVDKEGNAITNT